MFKKDYFGDEGLWEMRPNSVMANENGPSLT